MQRSDRKPKGRKLFSHKPRSVPYERLKLDLMPRSPNGTRRKTTTNRKRNLVTLDFGDDIHGIRPRLEAKARAECRSVSSVIREILKTTLIDFQVP